VARLEPAEYVRAVSALDHAGAARDILNYNYSVAVQAARKYRLVGRALAAIRVAIALWMMLLLVIAVWG
jgi:hypothetical protein